MRREKIPLHRALLYVAISVVGIWGSLFFAWSYHRLVEQMRQNDPSYTILEVIQATQSHDMFASDHLLTLLDLSKDCTIYACDLDQKKALLEACPLIEKAQVRRHHPHGLYVEYLLREPYLLLDDFENIAIDKNGYPFPLEPFYTPKRLPGIRLGLDHLMYNSPLQSEKFHLARKLYAFIQKEFPKKFVTLFD